MPANRTLDFPITRRCVKLSFRNSHSKDLTSLADDGRRHEPAEIYGSMAIVEFDMNGTIVFAIDRFLKVTGYALEEITGQQAPPPVCRPGLRLIIRLSDVLGHLTLRRTCQRSVSAAWQGWQGALATGRIQPDPG